MRRYLVRIFRQPGAASRDGVFYALALALASWALLVMLRSHLPDDADGLWIVSLAHDVLRGTPLRGWRLPGAPDYFPELLSVLVSSAFGFGVRSCLLIYGCCSWLAIGVAVYWGLRLRMLAVERALRIALLILLVFVALHSGSLLLQPFEFPFSHGGAALVGLFGLLYLAQGFERGFGWRGWLCAVFLLGLACASDRAILAQFVVPALLVLPLFVQTRMRQKRAWGRALGLLLLGPLQGELLTRLLRWGVGLRPGPTGARYGWSRSVSTLWRVCGDVLALAQERPFLAASVLLPTLFLGWRASMSIVRQTRERHKGSPDASQASLEAWLVCGGITMLAGTVAAVLVSNCWQDFTSFRYLLPIFILPLSLAAIVSAPTCWRPSPGWARLIELGLLSLVALVAMRVDRSTPRRLATLDSPARTCLDSYAMEARLQAGYAEYWSARPPMLLSRAGITLAQVSDHMKPRSWADNRYWSTRGFWGEQTRPRFSFVITAQLDESWLSARFGPPRLQQACFGLELWVYDRPEDVEFRNYLRSSVAQATGDDAECWAVLGKHSDAQASKGKKTLWFRGKDGISVPLPHVPANVLEIVSPTRKHLELHYLQAGAEVARQEVDFHKDDRRLLVVPAAVEMRSMDELLIRGEMKVRHKVDQINLMRDPEVESLRP